MNSNPFSYKYAARVEDWFKVSPKQLEKETYCDLNGYHKFKQKVYHGFSLKVEEFINEYAFESSWKNTKTQAKDKMYCIPGEIQFEGETERGLFTFCIGADQKVYHRHFTKKATEELLKYADPAFRNVDFPGLEESMQSQKYDAYEPVSMPNDVEDLVEHKPISDLLRISDRRHNIKLVLFKAQK